MVGSDGHVHTEEEMRLADEARRRGLGGKTRALDMFIASLNWLAYKAIYYSIAARYFRTDTFLHPIRHAYQIHWMQKTGAYGHDFTSKLVQALAEDVSVRTGEIIDEGRSAAVRITLPIFSAWLTAQRGDVRTVVPEALRLRGSQTFQDIRGILREIRIAYDEHGLREANRSVRKWQAQLAKASGNLRHEYALEPAQGIQLSSVTKVYNAVAALTGVPQFPEFQHRLRLPEFMRSEVTKSFANLYRDIAGELASVDRLEGMRDLLAARFVIDDRVYVAPKTEAPEFRWRSSDWKRPM